MTVAPAGSAGRSNVTSSQSPMRARSALLAPMNQPRQLLRGCDERLSVVILLPGDDVVRFAILFGVDEWQRGHAGPVLTSPDIAFPALFAGKLHRGSAKLCVLAPRDRSLQRCPHRRSTRRGVLGTPLYQPNLPSRSAAIRARF